MNHKRYFATAFAVSMIGALLAGLATTAQTNDIALPVAIGRKNRATHC
jgi:hypothetical protein